MKNKLIKGLFGLGLGLSAFALTTGVNANVAGGEGDSINGGVLTEQSQTGGISDKSVNVVVGEVDTTVYNVSLSWTSMQFNYRYNLETSSYEWVVTDICELVDDSSYGNKYDGFYSDSRCSIDAVVPYDVSGGSMYGKILGGKITITDSSVLGMVTPSIKWTSNEGYKAVEGKIQYETLILNEDGGEDKVFKDLVMVGSTELPSEARKSDAGCVYDELTGTTKCSVNYHLRLSLNTNTSLGTVTPTKGDAIGQMTVSFKAESTIE